MILLEIRVSGKLTALTNSLTAFTSSQGLALARGLQFYPRSPRRWVKRTTVTRPKRTQIQGKNQCLNRT